MGVPGLWKEIQSHGHDTALARLSELKPSSPSSSSRHTSLRIGIDISSWLFHAQKSIGGYNPQLRLLFYRLCRLLSVPDITAVFVFDGPLRPKEKRGKVVQKYRQVAFINDLKELITAFGFIVHDAVGEAEAEMAKMVQFDLLDAVMSDDVDCFVFGATLVIRNWGQELSGSKARNDYVAERSASDNPSASDRDDGLAQDGKDTLTSKERLALGTNLVTYFRASSLQQDGVSQAGLILVAILSGGDYDVQGLPRCGAKISMALARAGYGNSLIDGLKKHCAPPVRHSELTRLAAPQASESWNGFLVQWRDAVRQELSTNQSGHLGRRFKKLADSTAFAELLSTKASLSVLGSYVWPLVSESAPILSSTAIDIGRISQLCQRLFHWTAPHALETFRNNLWQGCAIRELSGDAIYNLRRTPKPVARKLSRTDSGKISTFFASKAKATEKQAAKPNEPSENASVILTIAGERENGSTGYVKEARAVCDVKAYVDLAKEGLDFSLSFHLEGEIPPPSSQSSITSPRKRKPLTDPDKELRLWLPRDVINRIPIAAKEMQQYQRKKSSKVATSENKHRSSSTDQVRLDSFFIGGKANVKPASSSTLKRRVPLQTSSQSSLSSVPSRSPSPPFRSPSKATSTPIQKKNAIISDWDSEILNSSDDEDINDKYYSNDDSTLPAIQIPTKAKQNIPADDSVEFISANVVTKGNLKRATAAAAATTSMPIEVSDDSDQD